MILCRPKSHRIPPDSRCQARPTPTRSRLAGPVFLPPASPSAWARSLFEAARRSAEADPFSIDSRPATAAGG